MNTPEILLSRCKKNRYFGEWRSHIFEILQQKGSAVSVKKSSALSSSFAPVA